MVYDVENHLNRVKIEWSEVSDQIAALRLEPIVFSDSPGGLK